MGYRGKKKRVSEGENDGGEKAYKEKGGNQYGDGGYNSREYKTGEGEIENNRTSGITEGGESGGGNDGVVIISFLEGF